MWTLCTVAIDGWNSEQDIMKWEKIYSKKLVIKVVGDTIIKLSHEWHNDSFEDATQIYNGLGLFSNAVIFFIFFTFCVWAKTRHELPADDSMLDVDVGGDEAAAKKAFHLLFCHHRGNHWIASFYCSQHFTNEY